MSMPKKLKPSPEFKPFMKSLILSITLLKTNLTPSKTTPAEVLRTVLIVSSKPLPNSFNLGATNLKSSTMLKVLNEGKYHEVPEQIKRWNKVNGKVNEGLVKRRKSEALLFSCQDLTCV